MEYINRIEIQGLVGCVRECTCQGMAIQNFSLSTDYIKVKGGSAIRETTWHQIVAWELAKVKKGDCVRVVGRLRTQRYTAVDGTERIFYEVVASEVEVISE